MEGKELYKCAAALTGYVCREYELSCDVHGENTEKRTACQTVGTERDNLLFHEKKGSNNDLVWFGQSKNNFEKLPVMW